MGHHADPEYLNNPSGSLDAFTSGRVGRRPISEGATPISTSAERRAPWEGYPKTIVEALDSGRDVVDVGYTFIRSNGQEDFFSWDRLRAEAVSRAHHFRGYGLKKGDRVALILPDGESFVPTFFGCLWAGLVPIPLYPPLSLGKLDAYVSSLVNILRKGQPAYVVTNKRIEQVIWAAIGKIPSLRGVISVDELAKPSPDASQTPEPIDGSDTAFLQFTSGSTSTPKGVVVTHENLRVNSWCIMNEGLQANPAVDRGVSWLPLYHDMGLIGFVLAPLFHRTPVTFLPTLSFVKNATLWLETLHRTKGTITFAPNFAYALVSRRAKSEQIAKWDLSHVRAFGCGAEPINPGTMQSFLKTFEPCGLKPTALLPCYGMAEATLAISFIGMDEVLSTDPVAADSYSGQKHARLAKEGEAVVEVVNCGRPFSGHTVGVMDLAGKLLEDRQVGEIVVKGASVTSGYFQDPAGTKKAFGDGWLHTGDLGYLVQGQIHIVGRQKDLIIINGRNYDPQRIEWIVEELPGVRKGSVVAFSRPGPSSEELVVVAEARETGREELMAIIRAKVNEQTQLNVADVTLVKPGALSKTSSGKLQRQKTRSQYLEGTLGSDGVRTLGGTAQKLMLAKHFTLSWMGRGQHAARSLMRETYKLLREPQASRHRIISRGKDAAQKIVDRAFLRLLDARKDSGPQGD